MKELSEGRAKIGGVRNQELFAERVRQSVLRQVPISEAISKRYITAYPALVPTDIQPFTPDMLEYTTPTASSRSHAIYVSIGESEIKRLRENPDKKGSLVHIVGDIFAHPAGIGSSDADQLTTSKNGYIINPEARGDPERPEGSHPCLHFDKDEKYPIADIENSPRRLIVNLGPDSRSSLIVVPYSVVDIVEDIFPEAKHYVPRTNYPINARLAELAEEPNSRVKVLWTEMKPGEGCVLPARVLFHDGSTKGKGRSDLAVFFEPGKRWREETLIENSLFK